MKKITLGILVVLVALFSVNFISMAEENSKETEVNFYTGLFDFSDNKRVVSQLIDDTLDHRMLLHRDDPAVPLLQELGEPMKLMDANPTAENIARLIFEFTAEQGFPIVQCQLWETPRCYAAYRPS